MRYALMWLLGMALLSGCRDADSTPSSAAPLSFYSVTDLGTLGEFGGYAAALNDKGQAVGQRRVAPGIVTAFVADGSQMTDLGTLGGRQAWASNINYSGVIVGTSQDLRGRQHAFRYSGGRMRRLVTRDGATSAAYDINDTGQIVGALLDRRRRSRAFLMSGGRLIELGTLGGAESIARAVNEHGAIVGGAQNARRTRRAFLWHNGAMEDIAAGEAFGINDDGLIVGIDGRKAWIHSGGKTSPLSPLDGDRDTYVSAINNRSQAVGSSSPDGKVKRAALWQNGRTYDLNTLVTKEQGRTLAVAVDINERGQILCRGFLGSQERSFLLTPDTITTSPQKR